MANRGGAVPIWDAYSNRTDAPTGWGGCWRSTSVSSTRLTSAVGVLQVLSVLPVGALTTETPASAPLHPGAVRNGQEDSVAAPPLLGLPQPARVVKTGLVPPEGGGRSVAARRVPSPVAHASRS